MAESVVGKGSKQRPSSVSREKYYENYIRIFKEKSKKKNNHSRDRKPNNK